MMTKPVKVKWVCPACGDDTSVLRDAYAEWNIETQEWELLDVYGDFACNACGATDIDPIEQEAEDT
jgi:predicted RNA-binding Zn-ribbon protein involved in translation (DUF1610 family)